MKANLSNNPGVALEIANRVMYSLKVLVVGLFIPFCFVFGITYKRHDDISLKSLQISKPNTSSQVENTVQFIPTINAENS